MLKLILGASNVYILLFAGICIPLIFIPHLFNTSNMIVFKSLFKKLRAKLFKMEFTSFKQMELIIILNYFLNDYSFKI